MGETSQKRLIASQKLVGLQVIDVKGMLVGVVKDVGVDLAEKQLVLFVTTKAKAEIDIPWSSIQSVEDVILLNKPAEIPSVPPPPPPPPLAPTVAPTTVSCPSCKSTAPAHAKFCPKCGGRLK